MRASSGLNENEIERMIEDADMHRQADVERRQLVELRNNAEGLIHTTQRSLDEYGDHEALRYGAWSGFDAWAPMNAQTVWMAMNIGG